LEKTKTLALTLKLIHIKRVLSYFLGKWK